jgi:hypothetical protein
VRRMSVPLLLASIAVGTVFAGPAASRRNQSTNATPAAISYLRWTDPHEGAFNLVVPQGWHVIGGAYRLSATDIRNGVTMMSPDGQIRIFAGDSNLGIYTQSTPALAAAGLREGGHQTLADGTRFEIRGYMTGQQFASFYAAETLRRQCAGLQVQSNNARPEIAGFFSQLASGEGMPSAQISAGDVSFTCNVNGKAVVGKFIVGTIVPSPGSSPLWFVYRIYGYLAPVGSKADAEKICLQAMQSWQIDPQWEARESQGVSLGVLQDEGKWQEIRAEATRAMRSDQQAVSAMFAAARTGTNESPAKSPAGGKMPRSTTSGAPTGSR